MTIAYAVKAAEMISSKIKAHRANGRNINAAAATAVVNGLIWAMSPTSAVDINSARHLRADTSAIFSGCYVPVASLR